MTVHRIMPVVEVVKLPIDIEEVSAPVVSEGKPCGEVQRHAVVARVFPSTLNFVIVSELDF